MRLWWRLRIWRHRRRMEREADVGIIWRQPAVTATTPLPEYED